MALDLSQIRKEIDGIDEQLIRLFMKRMDCTKRVAEYKTQNGLPVLNVQREREILEKVGGAAGERETAARLLFGTMMDISRAAQYPLVTKNHPLRGEFGAALNRPFAPKKIGFQGTHGSYSEAAAAAIGADAERLSFEHFEDVFQAVSAGEIDAGVVPAENSYAGSISENYDLLLKYNLKISAMVDLPIEHCLLTAGGDKSKIKKVYSHKQALAQCREYIIQSGFEPIEMENTAFAAKFVAESGDETLAAIAGERSAEIYGLTVAEKSIQSSNTNFTRFMAVSREMCVRPDADLISVAFAIDHTPGSLHKTLSMLSAGGMNLTRIESRPDKASPFRYVFYVDFTGNIGDEATASLLCGLSDELLMLKVFGNCKILTP